jgi:hypothetical protein
MGKSRNPEGMMAVVSESMHERTGRTLQEWVALVGSSGIDPLDQKAVRGWLKTEHGIPQNSQWAIADAAARAAGWKRPSVEAYVDQQYVGPKMALRPIFDRVRAIIKKALETMSRSRVARPILRLCGADSSQPWPLRPAHAWTSDFSLECRWMRRRLQLDGEPLARRAG